MSITPESAEQHRNDYAVVCCEQRQERVLLRCLEDPAIFQI